MGKLELTIKNQIVWTPISIPAIVLNMELVLQCSNASKRYRWNKNIVDPTLRKIFLENLKFVLKTISF